MSENIRKCIFQARFLQVQIHDLGGQRLQPYQDVPQRVALGVDSEYPGIFRGPGQQVDDVLTMDIRDRLLRVRVLRIPQRIEGPEGVVEVLPGEVEE